MTKRIFFASQTNNDGRFVGEFRTAIAMAGNRNEAFELLEPHGIYEGHRGMDCKRCCEQRWYVRLVKAEDELADLLVIYGDGKHLFVSGKNEALILSDNDALATFGL